MEMDEDDLKMVRLLGHKRYDKFCRTRCETLSSQHDKGRLSTAIWEELTDMWLYLADTQPTHKHIMSMTAKQWHAVDVISLRLNHALAIETTNSNPLQTTLTAATVTKMDMNIPSFLKYVHVNLKDKNQILSFYDNLVTQSAGFHIFIRPSDEINSIDGVVPDNMLPEVREATGIALYTKFQQKDSIDKEKSAAQNSVVDNNRWI